jgi:hypothetical protein
MADKIGGFLGGKKTPPPAPPAQAGGLEGLIGNFMGGGQKSDAPKDQGLAGAFNGLLGGGAKGEAKEGTSFLHRSICSS